MALSVGSRRPAVSRHPALWSPDFPHAPRCRDARPSSPLRCTVYPVGKKTALALPASGTFLHASGCCGRSFRLDHGHLAVYACPQMVLNLTQSNAAWRELFPGGLVYQQIQTGIVAGIITSHTPDILGTPLRGAGCDCKREPIIERHHADPLNIGPPDVAHPLNLVCHWGHPISLSAGTP